MSDEWQKVERQIADAKAEFEKYTKENPRLEALNVDLQKQNRHYNQKIVEAQAALDKIAEDGRTVISKATAYKADVKKYCEALKAKVEAEVAKLKAAIVKRGEELDNRKKLLAERELKVAEKQKENVAQSRALDESAKLLEAQATEISDAGKVLNTKAVDNKHETEMLTLRGTELDAREAKVVQDEAELAERRKAVEGAENASNKRTADTQRLYETNDLRKVELDSREAILNRKDEDIKARLP